MGVPPDPNAQTAGTRVEELAQRLAHFDAQSQENARLRRSLEAEVRARELVGLLERFLRPTAYRLACVHHTHRDANAVDRYVVHTLDGTRSVPFATAGMAQRFLGQ